jgi:hypothetical protein
MAKMRWIASFVALVVVVGSARAAEPEGSVPATQPGAVRARVKLGPWKERATRRLSDLTNFQPKAAPLDRFGGWKGERFKSTGFFYPQKIANRWWLIDPDGYRFLHIAVNGVRPGRLLGNDEPQKFRLSERAQKAFDTRFGSVDAWRDQSVKLLRSAGFNGTGSWSADSLLRTPTDRPVYTINLRLMSSYGAKRGGTFQTPGHTGYPNDCIFTFDPEFAADCEARIAAAVSKYKDDPYLLGYFSDNEMPFPKDSLDKYLKLPEKDAGRVEANRWIAAEKIDPKQITDEHRGAWLGHVADTYFGTVARALRKHDPNHLYLGSRLYGSEKRVEPLLKAAGKHLDVVSVNHYNVWTPGDEIKRLAKWSGRPILITEFYAKGNDSGLPNTEGAGWTVETQAERGAFYQNFTLGLLKTGDCVGWHWFNYMDNDPTDKGAGMSNQDANKGIVTATYEPYTTLLDAMGELNRSAYPLTVYFDR